MSVGLADTLTRTSRREFVVVQPPGAARGGLIHRLFAAIWNAAFFKAWQGGETPTSSQPQPKTTTERKATR